MKEESPIEVPRTKSPRIEEPIKDNIRKMIVKWTIIFWFVLLVISLGMSIGAKWMPYLLDMSKMGFNSAIKMFEFIVPLALGFYLGKDN
jgi:hypothetical protein